MQSVCKVVARDLRKGKTMSDYISREAVTNELEKHKYSRDYCVLHNIDWAIDFGMAMASVDSIPSADVRPNIHGHWERMSDLPEDKDDRYKCSRCGNVVHHSNGVNLYTFNSWCGACGSLNNSLIAGLEPIGEKGTE